MKLAYSFVALGVSLTAVGIAGAQPLEAVPTVNTSGERPARAPMGAPSNALELSVATGYTQGFGSLRSGVGMPSVVGPGLGVDVGIGWRIDPRLAVVGTGQYQEFTAERTSAARGMAGSIGVQYHLAPMSRVDPWVEAGVGYRLLWEVPNVGPTLTTHGFDVGKLRAGIDFRMDENVAIGPMIGADATLFLFQDFPNVQTNISDPTVSTFVYAGLQGRFDIGGQSTTGPRTVAAR